MSVSKIFIPNFVCVLPNKRYKTYQTGLSFCCLGHAPGVRLRGAGGAQGIAPDKAAYCVFTQFRGPENAIKLISVRTKTQ